MLRRQWERLPRWALAAFALTLLTTATRLPALLHPQPIDDEAVYSVVANEIVDGGRPYIEAVERKPPLLFWTYAAVFARAGKYNWPALHAVALIWTLATMAGLLVIGARLFNHATGLIAALLYSVFQPWATYKNLAFNGEMLMNLPIVWAWAFALRSSSSRLRPELIAAGMLLCAAFLIKQPAGIALVPLVFYVLLPAYRASRGLSWTASLIHVGMLAVGFVGVLDLVALVLRQQGILAEAFYWTILNHDLPHFFWEKGIRHTALFFGACLPLVLGAVMSCRQRLALWRERTAERQALIALVIASAIGTAAGARFYPHYYIQLVPALALLAAPFYAQAWFKPAGSWWWTRATISSAWLALTIIAFSILHWRGLAPHRLPTEAGTYIRQHSATSDRIFVWGHDPRIYLDAQRRPASRYVLTFPLTGYIFGGPIPGRDTRDRILPEAWATLRDDFAKHPPKYIVDASRARRAVYPITDFPELASLLARRYRFQTEAREGAIYAASAEPLP